MNYFRDNQATTLFNEAYALAYDILYNPKYQHEFFLGFNSMLCILLALIICLALSEHSKIITLNTLDKFIDFIGLTFVVQNKEIESFVDIESADKINNHTKEDKVLDYNIEVLLH